MNPDNPCKHKSHQASTPRDSAPAALPTTRWKIYLLNMIPALPKTISTSTTGGATADGGKDSEGGGGDGQVDSSTPPPLLVQVVSGVVC